MHTTQQSQPPAGRRTAGPALDSRLSTLDAPGFTLVELLVVIAVIAFLIAVLGYVLANLGTKARETATKATIKKIHVLLEQRTEAFDRAMDRVEARFQQTSYADPDYASARIRMRQALGLLPSDQLTPQQRTILIRKQLLKENFPQTFADARQTPPSGHDPVTESSELLYFMLTQGEVGGAPLVDAGEFLDSEVGDTDDDGLLEFIDAWGQPLRFYRWPTRLIIEDGSTHTEDDHERASLLIQGLPDHDSEGLLTTDPDDPLELLQAIPNFPNFESVFHTPNTYHVPLIVSAGPDGDVGLYEPNDVTNFGYLARPDLTNTEPLTDDITNRNQRTGD